MNTFLTVTTHLSCLLEKSNVQTLPTVMPKTQSERNSKIPETNFLRTGRPAGWSAGVSECLASGGCARECHQWLKHSPPSWYKLTVVLPSRYGLNYRADLGFEQAFPNNWGGYLRNNGNANCRVCSCIKESVWGALETKTWHSNEVCFISQWARWDSSRRTVDMERVQMWANVWMTERASQVEGGREEEGGGWRHLGAAKA